MRNRGQIPIGFILTGASMIGGVFLWTFATFGSVNKEISSAEADVGILKSKQDSYDKTQDEMQKLLQETHDQVTKICVKLGCK